MTTKNENNEKAGELSLDHLPEENQKKIREINEEQKGKAFLLIEKIRDLAKLVYEINETDTELGNMKENKMSNMKIFETAIKIAEAIHLELHKIYDPKK